MSVEIVDTEAVIITARACTFVRGVLRCSAIIRCLCLAKCYHTAPYITRILLDVGTWLWARIVQQFTPRALTLSLREKNLTGDSGLWFMFDSLTICECSRLKTLKSPIARTP